MVSGPRDQTLLQAARSGDQDAVLALLERYQDSVYRFGMRMCQNPADAEDVLQETLLTAAQKISDFRGEASFTSWLYAIARSGCSKHRRSTKRETELEADDRVDPSPHPDEAVSRKRLRKILERALASLEPAYREVLLLRDVEGLTAPEVADALGLTVAAVKSRLHRARGQLRERIEKLVATEASGPLAPSCPDVVAGLAEQLEEELTARRCADLETRLAQCSDPTGRFDPLRLLLGECRECGTEPPQKVKDSIALEIRLVLSHKG